MSQRDHCRRDKTHKPPTAYFATRLFDLSAGVLNTETKYEGCLSAVFRLHLFLFCSSYGICVILFPSPVLMLLTSAVPSCVLNVLISAHISADWGDFPVGHQGVRFLLLLHAEAEDVADRMILRRSGYFVVLHARA